MQQSYQSPIAAYATATYLLVLSPHEILCNDIMQVKKDFAANYECPSAVAGKPNIVLVKFEQYEMVEKRLLHRLELIAAAHPSFLIELNGFGSFPTHTIHINVTTKTQIVALIKSLRAVQPLLTIDKARKPHFITEPTITIAHQLLPWQYEKGWLELSHTHFSGKFMVKQFFLLRKRANEKSFTIIKKFSLLNEKNFVQQGELFG